MYAEPGKGAIHGAKDLRHGDVYLRLGLRLAYKLLKDAGFLPPEMQLRKEIATLKELLQAIHEGGDEEHYRLKCESPLTPGAKFCSSCGTASG